MLSFLAVKEVQAPCFDLTINEGTNCTSPEQSSAPSFISAKQMYKISLALAWLSG